MTRCFGHPDQHISADDTFSNNERVCQSLASANFSVRPCHQRNARDCPRLPAIGKAENACIKRHHIQNQAPVSPAAEGRTLGGHAVEAFLKKGVRLGFHSLQKLVELVHFPACRSDTEIAIDCKIGATVSGPADQ